MKRAGSFKKDKAATPAEKRVVRFGNAEIHSLPDSPRTPETNDGIVKGSASGHSASKGSALAAYLKVMENNGGNVVRKRPLDELEHTSHADSPPPPILSPGSRSPNGSHSSLASEAPGAVVLDSVDELVPSELAVSEPLPPPAISLEESTSKEDSDSTE
jgi:hypothetical protein